MKITGVMVKYMIDIAPEYRDFVVLENNNTTEKTKYEKRHSKRGPFNRLAGTSLRETAVADQHGNVH